MPETKAVRFVVLNRLFFGIKYACDKKNRCSNDYETYGYREHCRDGVLSDKLINRFSIYGY